MVEEDREICTYEFKHTERKDSAKGVEVKFSKSKRTKNVDVCHKVKYSAIIEVIHTLRVLQISDQPLPLF